MSPWKTCFRQWRLSASIWFCAFIPHELAGGVEPDKLNPYARSTT